MGTNLHHGDKDVVIPDLVDSLEWVLDSPPNVHQFDEPPVSSTIIEHVFIVNLFNCISFFIIQIVVEIEHLKNLKGPEHH